MSPVRRMEIKITTNKQLKGPKCQGVEYRQIDSHITQDTGSTWHEETQEPTRFKVLRKSEWRMGS